MLLTKKYRTVVNVILFQMAWFSCVLLGSHWALLAVILILSVHFTVVVPLQQRWSEAVLLLMFALVGFVVECFFQLSGALVYGDAMWLPPLWLLLLWVMFASTCRYSMYFLSSRLWLAALFGAISAPLSYYAGASLQDGISLNASLAFSVMVIGLIWSIVFPMLLLFAVPAASSIVLAVSSSHNKN